MAAAVLGIAAPRALADNEVWYWACQAPDGSPLPLDPANLSGFQQDAGAGGAVTFPHGCLAGALAPRTGETAVSGGAKAAVSFAAPTNTQIVGVKVTRATRGFGTPQEGDNQVFTLSTGAGPLETLERTTAAGDLSGELTKEIANPPSSGDFVRVGVSCNGTAPCGTSGVSFDVARVGMRIAESTANDGGKPTFAPGGTRNPVGGYTDPALNPPDPNRYLNLDIQATDGGAGLYYAEAFFDGQPPQREYFDPSCRDLTPATPAVDLPYGAVCPTVDEAKITLDAGVVPNGIRNLIIRVADVLGHVKEFTQATEVLNNVDLGKSSQSLAIGTSGVGTTPGSNNNNNSNKPSGGILGASSQNCTTPRLSAMLADKPVRFEKGVPVLRSGKRYKFTGRLTCLINGKRKSAPKRARIDLQNKIGKKTSDKSGTTVADKGNFSIILAYTSSRTLIFRFTNSDGKRSQVSIKIKIEKPKKKKH